MAHKLDIVANPAEPTIVTQRTVDAPRNLVFDAFTKTEHLARWMGPRALTMRIDENDLRPGGRWRFVHIAPDGKEFAFHGIYEEIARPERIVRTFAFEVEGGFEARETFTLTEQGGKTTITTLTVHKTLAARDMHLTHGMEQGMTEGYARLDELLASLQGPKTPEARA